MSWKIFSKLLSERTNALAWDVEAVDGEGRVGVLAPSEAVEDRVDVGDIDLAKRAARVWLVVYYSSLSVRLTLILPTKMRQHHFKPAKSNRDTCPCGHHGL